MAVIRGSLEELVIMIDAGELIGFCYADMKFKKNIGEVWTWVVACPICGKQHRYPAQSFQINEDWIIERVPSLCDETKELILLKKSWKRRLATVGTITNRKSIPARVKKMIYRRSGGRCWYCGDQLVRHGFFHGEIDHVRPIALGGDNDRTTWSQLAIPATQRREIKPCLLFERSVVEICFGMNARNGRRHRWLRARAVSGIPT